VVWIKLPMHLPAKVNTRQGQVAMQKVEDVELQQKIRQRDLLWARRWRDGDAQCPRCAGAEFQVVDVESQGRMRYESFRCRDAVCNARWKVEFCESALAIVSEGGDEDWIDLLSHSDHDP
jgi:hypothetical protein